MSNSQVPPIQRLGDAVLLQGPILAELRWVLGVGINVVTRRDAVVPASMIALRAELNRAIADRGDAATPQSADPESSVLEHDSDGISTVEAAAILGLQPRQVRHIHERLGGRRVGSTWVFDVEAVEAEVQRRREHRQ